MNRFGAGLSTRRDPLSAAREATEQAGLGLDGEEPDLVCVFASAEHADSAEGLVTSVVDALQPSACVGAIGASGVIGPGREVEHGAAVAVWAARLPGSVVEPFRLRLRRLDGTPTIVGDPGISEAPGEATRVMLADPYTFPTDALLERLNHTAPGQPVVGGLVGGAGPGAARLFDGSEVVTEGAVGVSIREAGVLPLVSQGCRPIGPDLVVTAAARNAVLELAGQPALVKLREIIGELPAEERDLAEQGILAGLVIDENRPDYGVGDFLVRVVMGVDAERDALLIGDVPRVGQTFRFHVRDEASADAELHAVLADGRRRLGARGAGAALLFSCTGRGSNLFSTPDHDASQVAGELGAPSAGIFCQGEIGPVAGENHLHGYTATVALFPG